MLPGSHPDRIQITFDDHRLVANVGLLLPATLARRLGLPELVREYLDLGNAPGRANTGDKMMTLVASALAGGDCIDDADVLRTGGTARVLGFTAKAPSTLGAFLRSFRWGHVRQLDRVSRELLARAWKAGAGPGDAPFTKEQMNAHERRKRRGICVAFLSEVIADVLAEAQQDNSAGWLMVNQVRARVGFELGQGANEICRGVLNQMHLNDEVEYERKAEGEPYVWRLLS